MINFLREFFKTKGKYFLSSLPAVHSKSEYSCKTVAIRSIEASDVLITFTFLHSLCLLKQEYFIKMRENFKLSSWCFKVYKVWFITHSISKKKDPERRGRVFLDLLINSLILCWVFQVSTVNNTSNNVILLFSDRKMDETLMYEICFMTK